MSDETSMEKKRLEVTQVTTATDVPPINVTTAFEVLTPEEQHEVTQLAESIDVTRLENVMAYGSEVLMKTFEQCGQFLKSERGSNADQEVIKRVVELTKKANESYDDFELVLQEPNLFEKIFLKANSKKKKNRTQKIQTRAVTNYKLLAELKDSCEAWLEMLRSAMDDITFSALSDSENLQLLEKYIIAGEMAKARTETELTQLQQESQNTGLRAQAQQYDDLKEGYDIFVLRLSNLEKSRVMYYLSIAQLKIIKQSNMSVQSSVHIQSENCIALIGQQLRNAVLNAKNQEVIEGQRALSRLSDELIKDVSRSIGVTAGEAEKLLYYGIYNTDAAKEAVKTVISSCESIKQIAEEMLPKMRANLSEMEGLVEELRPYIDESTTTINFHTDSQVQVPTTEGARLKF